MNKQEWAEEIVKLYFEGKSVSEANEIVRKQMKEKVREELADGRIEKIS